MSRPSATQSPLFTRLRCFTTSAARTRGSVAILEAASETSGVRISSVTSRPSSFTRLPTSMSTSRARSPASPGLSTSDRATARYMAPESRYEKPTFSASARATLLLPAPAGPSMATTMRGSLSARDQRAHVGLEAGVGHGGRIHAHDLNAVARGEPRHGAEHRDAVVAASVDRPALDAAVTVHDEPVRCRLDVHA